MSIGQTHKGSRPLAEASSCNIREEVQISHAVQAGTELFRPLRVPVALPRSPLTPVTFSSLWGRLFTRKETKVLILGLDNAGKVRSVILVSSACAKLIAVHHPIPHNNGLGGRIGTDGRIKP